MNTFYHGDCLFVMNHDIEPNSIDLIYLDPPFFTGKVQKGASNKWNPAEMPMSYDDSKKFWGDSKLCEEARTKSPNWLQHIATSKPVFASYLWYMMQRLAACNKVLKPTGSIYLHCDWRASHYLKMIMDEIFSMDNFKSEIIWYRPNKIPDTTKRLFYKTHDTILFYTKSDKYTFNTLKKPTGELIIRKKMKKINGVITNTKETIKYERQIPLTKSVIIDINDIAISRIIKNKSERIGYPTQKPLALLKRLLEASTNKGDTILDPFCGCGTATIAAQLLGRHWIGIDINKDAYTVSKDRYHQLPLETTFGQKEAQYVERTLSDVKAIDKPQGKDSFEEWVNGYFKAHKPMPDRGVDGITQDGVPIQTKTFLVTSKWVRNLLADAILHKQVKQPCKHAILVSQVGFDDTARQQQFEIQTKEGIQVDLLTPELMLKS